MDIIKILASHGKVLCSINLHVFSAMLYTLLFYSYINKI